MTHFEYDLAFRVVIGLAGCAMAFVAVVLDWRERRRRTYTLDFGDKPISTTWTSRGFVSLDTAKVGDAVERVFFKEPKA